MGTIIAQILGGLFGFGTAYIWYYLDERKHWHHFRQELISNNTHIRA